MMKRFFSWFWPKPKPKLDLINDPARLRAFLTTAMETLRQIERTPRNAGAKRMARATILLIEKESGEKWMPKVERSRSDAS